jgi:hypothetical protein
MLGCASIHLPTEQVAGFEASLVTAKQMGVEHVPIDRNHRGGLGMSSAKEHFVLGKEEAEVAKEMAAAGDKRAVLLLARAQSDLDLAVGLTREASAHADATCPAGSCSSADAHDSRPSLPPPPIWTMTP